MAGKESEIANLYQDGWRQGSVFHLDLTLHAFVLELPHGVAVQQVTNRTWVVASQDCDLAGADPDDNDAFIEVRPVVEDNAGDWGVRSRKVRLDDRRCVLAEGVPGRVSPALLDQVARASRERPLADSRAGAFKTWLGLRFDRPAVPDHLVPLAQDIAKRVRGRSGRAVAAGVHDVLMQFDDSTSPPRASLFAIVLADTDHDDVQAWLAHVALLVPANLGVLAAIDVGTKAETSLELIETSYAADASQITWRGPDPEGAV